MSHIGRTKFGVTLAFEHRIGLYPPRYVWCVRHLRKTDDNSDHVESEWFSSEKEALKHKRYIEETGRARGVSLTKYVIANGH